MDVIETLRKKDRAARRMRTGQRSAKRGEAFGHHIDVRFVAGGHDELHATKGWRHYAYGRTGKLRLELHEALPSPEIVA